MIRGARGGWFTDKVCYNEPRQPCVWKTNHDSRMEIETLTVSSPHFPKIPVGLFRMQCGEDNEYIAREKGIWGGEDGEQL